MPENVHIGLVAIKPGTGEILAMYGGQDYLKYQFNAATQGITSGGSSPRPLSNHLPAFGVTLVLPPVFKSASH